ncbi:MAG: hypothetical protein PWP14_1200 [Methanolobus sp.]|jgi:predicted transcriptional regulator|nr:hypothetical protein [Methanolobus sp.]
MYPLVNTTEFLDMDIEYWGTHNIGFVPTHFLERINELGACTIMSPSTEKMYEAHYEFNQMSKMQKSQFSITSSFYPNFPAIIMSWFIFTFTPIRLIFYLLYSMRPL